ncbi:hypothetical protein MPLSOD_40592 [Mesorhizobium sp. SOD10]|nr:hypothetical protein MPLSOD_40592 [Mesorhizobium sp. SOD10]
MPAVQQSPVVHCGPNYVAVHPSNDTARNPAPVPAAPCRPLESQQDLPPKEVMAKLLMGRTTAVYIVS